MKGSQKIIDTLIRLKDDIPCEICHLKPATQTLPRGPKNEGHVNVCDDCCSETLSEWGVNHGTSSTLLSGLY